jgi:hypothetical protein
MSADSTKQALRDELATLTKSIPELVKSGGQFRRVDGEKQQKRG